jgi:hypothetical protein
MVGLLQFRTISSVSNIIKIRVLTYLQRCFTASKNNPQFSAVPSAESARLRANVIEVVVVHLN